MRKPTPKAAPLKNGEIDWQAQLRFDFAWAERILKARGELGPPMFVIWTRDSITPFLIGNWDEPERRDAVCRILTCWCIEHDAHAVSFIAEAWTRLNPSGDYVAPSKASDRIEIVNINIEYRSDTGKRVIGGIREIMRRGSGHVVGLRYVKAGGYDLLDHDNEVLPGSRVAEILPVYPVTSELERETAKRLRETIQKELGFNLEEHALTPRA